MGQSQPNTPTLSRRGSLGELSRDIVSKPVPRQNGKLAAPVKLGSTKAGAVSYRFSVSGNSCNSSVASRAYQRYESDSSDSDSSEGERIIVYKPRGHRGRAADRQTRPSSRTPSATRTRRKVYTSSRSQLSRGNRLAKSPSAPHRHHTHQRRDSGESKSSALSGRSDLIPIRKAPTTTKTERRRAKCIAEILSTEETYVRKLEELKEAVQPINTDARVLKLRSESKGANALLAVARGAQQIYGLQKQFLQELQIHIGKRGNPTPNVPRTQSSPIGSLKSSKSASSRDSNHSGSMDSKQGRRPGSPKSAVSLRSFGQEPPPSSEFHDNPVGAVAAVFNRFGQFFKMYIGYLNDYQEAMAFLREEMKAGWRHAGIKDRDSLIFFSEILIQPVLRIPRYVLLLKELRKNCEDLRKDSRMRSSLKALNKALDVVKQTAEQNEIRMRLKENSDKMTKFQEQIVDGSQILAPHRRLERHEHVSVAVVTKNGKSVKREAKIALFNDLVFVSCRCPKLKVYLGVTVIRARELPKTDASNYYAKIYVSGIPTETEGVYRVGKTPPKANTQSPVWKASKKGAYEPGINFFEVILDGYKEYLPPLYVEIWENSTFQRNEFVGQARIELKPMFSGVPAEMEEDKIYTTKVEQWYQLSQNREFRNRKNHQSPVRQRTQSTDISGSSNSRLEYSLQSVSGRTRKASVSGRSRKASMAKELTLSSLSSQDLGEVKIRCDMFYSLGFHNRSDNKMINRRCRRVFGLKESKTPIPVVSTCDPKELHKSKYYQYINLVVDEALEFETNLTLDRKNESSRVSSEQAEGETKYVLGKGMQEMENLSRKVKWGKETKFWIALQGRRAAQRTVDPVQSPNSSPRKRLGAATALAVKTARMERAMSFDTKSSSEGMAYKYVLFGDLKEDTCKTWTDQIRKVRLNRLESTLRADLSRVIQSNNSKKQLREFLRDNKLFVDLRIGGTGGKDHGETALMACAERGHLDLCRLLCFAGAHVNHADSQGQTPLSKATQNGHVSIAKTLLDARANPYHLDKDGVACIDLVAPVDAGMNEVYKAAAEAHGSFKGKSPSNGRKMGITKFSREYDT